MLTPSPAVLSLGGTQQLEIEMKGKEALEWLARNVHKWQDGKNFICYSMDHGCHIFHEHNKNCAEWFTHQEWLSMREKLQNKPKFADHPDAKCFVQNADGQWFKSDTDSEIYPIDDSGFWGMTGDGYWTAINEGIVLGDWRDTLEKRPNGINDMTPVAIPLDVNKHVNMHELQKVIIQNRAAATFDAQQPGPSEMTITTQDNSWHERGELPPVGTVCEYLPINCWTRCVVEFIGNKYAILGVQEFEVCVEIENIDFRPLRTEREKAIDAALSVLHIGGNDNTRSAKFIIEKLYDAGMLK